MRMLAQRRADFALERVMAVSPNIKDQFKRFSAGAPSMILQNGFGQALAFWVAKGKGGDSERMAMFHIVKDWLCYDDKDVKNRFLPKVEPPHEFFAAISKMSQSEYLSAQNETLALLEWIKRFANAGF